MPTAADQLRRRNLVRMKVSATGLLLVAAATYVLAWRAETAGGAGWVGYLRAAAEAGVVGGLADWFAVTALFRHPLGLPIPHTALIPTRKDALAHNLSDFVGTNFLSEEVVRGRLGRANAAARIGSWLLQRPNAERVVAEMAVAMRSAIGVLRDDDVRAMVEDAVVKRLADVSAGPPLGRLLGQVVAERAHSRLVDLAVDALHKWLRVHREAVLDVVAAQAPVWSPRVLDRRVAARVHSELLRISGEVATDPQHPLRRAVDRFLAQLADDLRHDPGTIARVERIKAQLLARPDLRRAFGDLVAAARALLLDLLEDPSSDLRVRATDALVDLGRRLDDDPAISAKVNAWIGDAVAYVVTNYRDELTRTITDTVERWDGDETSRKIELQVGRDLQFIRINGTVVGALAGLAIHTVTRLLL